MKLSKKEIEERMSKWAADWNSHDLEAVMDWFHDDIVFEHWTGAVVKGKENLCETWKSWFENHGDFFFREELISVDEDNQRVIWQWSLEWPSPERGYVGKPERRRGIDILWIRDGKVIRKNTYSKTTVEIGDTRIRLTPNR
ncbi:MAG: nuclear transport factor 2 family protein [Deltaproteobacteria bacterium]|nr:nuclear transport factor 2 family protein [Deltaproteobacteria bacterium]